MLYPLEYLKDGSNSDCVRVFYVRTRKIAVSGTLSVYLHILFEPYMDVL